MLNKFFKTIHNKYSRIFKFIFFLRYLFAVFLVAISLFLTIPMFFNYEKKAQFLKDYLKKDYNFEINKYTNIKYKAFPVPRIELKNVQINLDKSRINLDTNKLKIYPKIFSIYDFDNFKAKKILLTNNYVNLDSKNLKYFVDSLLNQKNRLSFNNLNIKILNQNKFVLSLENLYFANFGYKKYLITGKVFEKKFNAQLGNDFKSVNFNILNTGINAKIQFDENQVPGKKSGIFKSKILNSNLRFNFDLEKEKLKIYDSFFRSKNITFNNEVLIIFSPFLDINTNFVFEEFNFKILEKIDFNQILILKEKIKKINSKNQLNFKSKKFTKNIIDDLKIQIDLAYGRINYKKEFFIADNHFRCVGNLNILEEFPLLYFNCLTIIDHKKELLKKLSIKMKVKNDTLNLLTKGNINILNQKVNFDKVSLNNENFSQEDLKYFKSSFENIFLDKGFLEILNLKKIKNFILDVI